MIYKRCTGASGLADSSFQALGAFDKIWGFPKIRSTILGDPIIRTIVYWGLHGGTLILGNYHMNI